MSSADEQLHADMGKYRNSITLAYSTGIDGEILLPSGMFSTC